MAFDFNTLLETIADPGDRQSFSEIATRYPVIQDYLIDPQEKALVASVEKWQADNWDEEHGMTKAEYAQAQRLEEMQRLIDAAPAGDNMTLEQLNENLDKMIAEGKVLSPAQAKEQFTSVLQEREKNYGDYISQQLNVMGETAVRIPYLNQKYKDEFGELFDPNQFLKDAAEKRLSLDQAYESMAAPKRAEAQAKKHAEEVAAAEKRGRQAAIEERAMNPQTGQAPTIEGSPQLGHFQAKLMGEQSAKKDSVPDSAELGSGLIARTRAREADRAEMMGSAV